MRPLILLLTIFPLAAICSCHSSRQTHLDYADTTSVTHSESGTFHATNEILSLLSTSRELDLSGIRLDFYPPDPAHPDSRAAPKSLTVETAKTKESTEQSTHGQAAADGQKTVNLSSQSSSGMAQDTRSDNNVISPADWCQVVYISFAILFLLLLIILLLRKLNRRCRSPA